MLKGKYYISRGDDDDSIPEESFVDSLSNYSKLEEPIDRQAFRVLGLIVALVLLFFTGRAFQLQVIKGNYYSRLLDRNSSLRYSVLALRGIIYDAKNQPLVENIPVFDLIAYTNELPPSRQQRNQLIDQMSTELNLDLENTQALFEKNKNTEFFTVKSNITKAEVIKIQTANLKGLYIVADSQRHYLENQIFAHVLGYTAKVSKQDLDQDVYYLTNDRIGRFGLEQQYEDILRGEHRSVVLNDKNDVAINDKIKTGGNLVLTIDKDVQEHLYSAMANVFNAAGVRRGAAIVQNPKTGAILGMVSFPSYDPNIFENSNNPTSSELINNLLNNTDHPLFNRAVSGRYSPGSTIKPLYALAGLQENIVTPKTTINATGSISVPSKYDPKIIYTFRDWKIHGLTDIRKAIADSVDIYFYILGGGYQGMKGLGIDTIIRYLKQFRADSLTGIDLPQEAQGFIPSPDWKQKITNNPWSIGDTYNVSIGQGDLVVTPIWLASYISALANGGSIMKPYIVKEIQDANGNPVQTTKPQTTATLNLNSDDLRVIKEGMRQTVTSGTAQLLQDLPIAVAAKTGTAQITAGHNLNSLFVVFGPSDNPSIVMTILVEEIPKSQSLGVQVANNFLLWYFGSRPR